MDFKNFISEFVEETKNNIVDLAEKNLCNQNKKLMLDERIFEFLEDTFENLKLNFILKLALKKLLLPNISIITQIIFDLLKTRIEGITK